MEDDGGGGGGWDFNAFKAMINADNPELLARYAVEHYKLARELHDVVYDLDRSLGQLDEVFSSQHAAPALKARLLQSIGEMDNVGTRVEGNSRLLDQAAQALHRAREAVNGIKEDDPDASPRAEGVRDQLSFEYGTITPQLDTFGNDDGYEPGSPNEDGTSNPGADGGRLPGSREATGGGLYVPTKGPRSGSSPTSKINPGPTLGGRLPTGGELHPGAGSASSSTGTGGRAGIGTGAGAGSGDKRRVGIPGARSGAPIGGYRPVAGTSGSGGGAAPPGGSAAGEPGTPGGPGRPGMAPPGGTGPGQPGKDRPGRRLTNYEKLEPNVFRDTRHRVNPVIGEQRRQPDTFKPTPGAIGGKKATEERPKAPDMPTREAPMQFEGHDMSVTFERRTRGGQ